MTKRKSKRTAKGRNAEPKAAVTLAASTWDHGAKGLANRQGLAVEKLPEPNPNGVKRARRVDMLEVWFRKGLISPAGMTAAERLRDAFEATERAPGTDYAKPRVDSSPKPDQAIDIQIDRVSKFIAAAAHISDGDRAIIEACVLDRGTPMRIKKYRGRGYETGLSHLSEALDRMAKSMGSS